MLYNEILKATIPAFAMGITYILIGMMMLNKKIKFNMKNTIIVGIFSLIIVIIHLFFNNFMRTLPIFLIVVIVLKKIFKENTDKVIVTAFVSYGIIIIGELLYALLVSLIFGTEFLSDSNLNSNIIVNNLSISIISILIVFILRKKLKKIVQNISDKRNIINIILCLTIILILSLLIYKLYSNSFVVDEEFIINGILMIIAFIIGLYLFIQKLKINLIEQNYQRFILYSQEMEEIIEEYRILQHEFKNELIIIRGMLNNQAKKAKEYINNLLNEKDMGKYLWAQELKNIQLDGLKGLLNYKILHMINLGIDINVMVSKEIKNSKLKDLDANQKRQLHNIIGVYVDNAIEAAVETKKKEIKIDVYINKKDICFSIANTYEGEIPLDKIDNPGFSTKEKGHGYGLTLVRNILKSTDIFTQERKIMDDLYIQKLYIK